jgi:hypothetical protein
MFATALAQALLALHGNAAAALSWFAGCVAFVFVVAFGHDLLLRSELGFAVGLVVAGLAMLVCLALRMRSGAPMEGGHELPTR